MTEPTNDVAFIDVTDDGTIVVQGDIDMATAPLLTDTISRSQEHRPEVVIDLGGVSFVDSSGLRSLLDATRRAQALGAKVVLRSVGPGVARMLDITGTASRFHIDGTYG